MFYPSPIHDINTLQVPTVIYLERVDTRERLSFTALPNEIDPSILCQDTNISS